MQLALKTQNLPVEHFGGDLKSVCGEFDIRPSQGAQKVWGGVGFADRMGLEMALVATNLQQIVRTSKNIRQDDGENYFLIVQEEGRALMGQNDMQAVLHPGDMVLIDSASPSDFTFFGDRSRQLSLHLPRVDLEERYGANIPGGLALSHEDPTAKAIHAIITKSMGVIDSSIHLKEALFSLIGVFLSERQINTGSAAVKQQQLHGSILSQAIGYIETRYRDPEFTANAISEDLGLQAYQVQRAFKDLGTTATKYLLAKRLEAARDLLVTNKDRAQTELISTIAFRAGFSDISYFNRRFREVFGCAPGSYYGTG